MVLPVNECAANMHDMRENDWKRMGWLREYGGKTMMTSLL